MLNWGSAHSSLWAFTPDSTYLRTVRTAIKKEKIPALRQLASCWEDQITNQLRKISIMPDGDTHYGTNMKTYKWRWGGAATILNSVAMGGLSEKVTFQ